MANDDTTPTVPYAQMPDDFEWTEDRLAFDRRCKWAPWEYGMYDDYAGYKEGEAIVNELRTMSRKDDGFAAIYHWHLNRPSKKGN